MNVTVDCLNFEETGAFSKIVTDYMQHAKELNSFIAHHPDVAGIEAAIKARQEFTQDRIHLVTGLQEQYKRVVAAKKVSENIDHLLSKDTFTITTAHQPNIFTGHLYFVYKIVHTIKLAEYLKTTFPQFNFVPVYYMGSEDADLDELGHIFIDHKKYTWNTNQQGAVGRMVIDDELIKLIEEIKGQIGVLPQGMKAVEILKTAYKKGQTIEQATFTLVHTLFADYGLVVFLPDNSFFKKKFIPVMEKELLAQPSAAIVRKTSEELSIHYKVQASPRDINLFYLHENRRERIELIDGRYRIVNTDLSYTKEEILYLLQTYPERFSPNVILRGVYQETVLPNIAFVGGGGELAYWLQLRTLFEFYKVPYPVQLLRNSFLFVTAKWTAKIAETGFALKDFFQQQEVLLQKVVLDKTTSRLSLAASREDAEKLYAAIYEQATAVDASLGQHVQALRKQALYRLTELEKKMLRAEKRKYGAVETKLIAIKEALFPAGSLQERYDNLFYYYALWGEGFIEMIYKHSPALDAKMVMVTEV